MYKVFWSYFSTAHVVECQTKETARAVAAAISNHIGPGLTVGLVSDGGTLETFKDGQRA